MRRILATTLLILLGPRCALAWDAPGHVYTGAIADQLLNAHARQEVRQILGFSLAVAGPWADCVKSVHPDNAGQFRFRTDPGRPEWTDHCTSFMNPAETARMEDYVRRNWSNCPAPHGHGCHETYHYTDVSIARDRYQPGDYGATPHDVVASINAAVMVLQGKAPPAPYSIRDKKEALFLIDHFVSDLHQPLHVGAVYLTEDGARIDPDAPGTDHTDTSTAGGNFIHDLHTNLHAEWDHLPDDLTETPSPTAIEAAELVPRTEAAPGDMAAIWASDTLLQARTAFANVAFAPAGQRGWKAKFRNRPAYIRAKNGLQERQLIKGGAHLAEVLNAIWP